VSDNADAKCRLTFEIVVVVVVGLVVDVRARALLIHYRWQYGVMPAYIKQYSNISCSPPRMSVLR
jgi:hypothetical protein